MSLVAEYHSAHKERLARFAKAASSAREKKVAPPFEVPPAPPPSPLMERIDGLERQLLELQEVVARQSELLAQAAKGIVDTRPTFTEIMDCVCEFYGLRHVDLTSSRRTWNLTKPRQITCYLGRHLTGMSLPQIGRRLGGRDHTSILHGANKIENEKKTNEVLRDDIDVLELKIAEKVLNRQMPRGQINIHRLPTP